MSDQQQPKEYIITGSARDRCLETLIAIRDSMSTPTDEVLISIASLCNVYPSPHPAPASSDETIAGLLSENARIGAELKRMTEKAERLSGEHDAAVARVAREDALDDIAQFVQKGTWTAYPVKVEVVSKAPLMRFLESLRGERE